MRKKILAIVRVSTTQQETESQHIEVENFCISKGYKKQDIIFIEAKGASARKLNKVYLDFLQSIKDTIKGNQDIKAVAMWHLNRLGRVEKCLLEMKDFFIENQVQVYIKEPSLTLLNDDGTINNGTEIAWSVFATMVKQDTKELFAKFERGRENNRRNGKYNGGAFGALYGYMVNDEGYIIPNPTEAAQVNDIYNMYASGKYSIRSLVKELKERGVTFRGRKVTENNISKMLVNTAYIGFSSVSERKYHPIISESLWQKVESVRKLNDLQIKTKESKNTHLAIKLLKCQHCGHNYTATKNMYICYKHVHKQRFDEDCSESVAISISLMDRLLWDVAYMKHLDFMQDHSEKQIESLNERKAILLQKIAQSEKQIENLKPSLERAQDLYINGDIDRAKFDTIKAKNAEKENAFKAEIKAYRQEIRAIEKQIESLKEFDVDRFVDMAFNLDDESTQRERKDIVNQHIKSCFVERCVIDGRKAISIQINTFEGKPWKYMYFYTIKDKERQLYMCGSDGSLKSYPHPHTQQKA